MDRRTWDAEVMAKERKYSLIPGWNEPRTFWANPEMKIPENAMEVAVKEYIDKYNITGELTSDDVNMAMLQYQIRWLREFNTKMQREISPRMKRAGRLCLDWADALERGIKKGLN
jgi:hypothetical protein